MRAVRKPKLVEPKRTRSCVVRLEKVRAPITKASLATKSVQQKSIQQKSIQQKSIQQKSIQQKPIQQKSIQQKTIQQKSIQQKSIQQKSIQQKSIQPKSIQQKSIQQKSIQQKSIQQDSIQQKSIQQESIQQKSIQSKSIQQKSIQQKSIQQKSIQQKSIQQDSIQQKSIQQESIQQKSIQPKSIQQKSISQDAASGKINISTRAAAAGINSKATKAAILIINPNNTKTSQNNAKASPNNTTVSTPISAQQDDKKYQGPLKKRPLGQTAFTPSPKFREKPVPVARTPKQPVTPVEVKKLEETPTIAAGRSRRAIKPNPKYASEDIVTPKVIKHTVQLTPASNRKSVAAATPATGPSTSATEKKRKISSSSSEDLYNKDSSDADYAGLNDILDEKDSDSDFSDFDLHVPPSRFKNRARPKLPEKTRTQTQAPPAIVKPTVLKSAPTPKALPSHLQQLRKTIAVANASRLAGMNKPQPVLTGLNRSQPPVQQSSIALAKKRKLYKSSNDSDTDSDSDSIAKRRKVYTTPNMSKDIPTSTALPNMFPLNHKTLMTRKSLTTNTTINGSKITSVNPFKRESDSLLQKRKVLLEKSITNRPASKALPTKVQNPIEPLKMPAKNVLKQTVVKPRTASPATTPKVVKPSKEETEEAKPVDATPSLTVDDFETMPTFTIVNINDIINKKGDVLISKSASTLSKTSKDSDSESESSDAEDMPTEGEPIDTKHTRRKTGHTKILTEKVDAAQEKKNSPVRNSSFTPASTKKPAQTILNHTLSNKNATNKQNPRMTRASNSNSSNKPAPRILNSMVAKKTQPVKPLIANLEDSADETFSTHPMEDDDFDAETDEEEDDSYLGKSRAFASKKSTPVVTKENSLAATNRQTLPTMKAAQRKISPEKVVISRQGDKIIKKITCFETWYIINLPEDHPAEVVRNQLDMPLIKLANASKMVVLPTSNWSSKVTLYQLAVGALSKANYTTYTGDLHDQHIPEEDRGKYQPSCVMFRRAVTDRTKSRLPYDRAVIFKNKTFYTNIEGKNVKLVGAPFKISSLAEVEILLQLVDELTLQSAFVEQTATVQ